MSHTCPRDGCTARIPDRFFSCRADWFALSKPVQDEIYATAGKGVTRERIDAVKAAREEWREDDP